MCWRKGGRDAGILDLWSTSTWTLLGHKGGADIDKIGLNINLKVYTGMHIKTQKEIERENDIEVVTIVIVNVLWRDLTCGQSVRRCSCTRAERSVSQSCSQTGPLSLVELLHYCALIGRDLPQWCWRQQSYAIKNQLGSLTCSLWHKG